MLRQMGALAIVLVAIAASDLLTVITGIGQTSAVSSDPTGADCSFRTGELPIARVNPTPGVMHVGKSGTDIEFRCSLAGYRDAVGKAGSEFQPATFGNIILGGVIGVVVDAASGAMTKYPETVTFTLVPIEFSSAAERDRLFGNLKNLFLSEYEEVLSRIKQFCDPGNCSSQIEAAESSRANRLSEIEGCQMSAKIKST